MRRTAMGWACVVSVSVGAACFGGPTGEAWNAPPFSADLVNLNQGSQPPTRVYIGNGRLRLESARAGKSNAFVFDPQKGTLLVIDDQAKTYIDAGMFAPVVAMGMQPMLRLFRPATDGDPCTTWNGTVNQFAAFGHRGEKPPHFSCSPAGTDVVDGRPAHKWAVTTTGGNDNGPQSSTVWIDDRLHVLSKSQDQNGAMEMHNIREGQPSADLFVPPAGYQKVSVTDLLSKFGKSGTGT